MKKLKGAMGVRLEKNDAYGPTGEDFIGTNLIGVIKSNLDLIKTKNKGDIIYLVSR